MSASVGVALMVMLVSLEVAQQLSQGIFRPMLHLQGINLLLIVRHDEVFHGGNGDKSKVVGIKLCTESLCSLSCGLCIFA